MSLVSYFRLPTSKENLRIADRVVRVDGTVHVYVEVGPYATLAHNLAIVGALQKAWYFGFNTGTADERGECDHAPAWLPWEGVPAPGFEGA